MLMLQVMTYNVRDGGVGRAHYIAKVLRVTKPDVVVLQEVFHAEFTHELAQSLNMYSLFCAGNTSRHLALISRLPIVSWQSYHPFPPIQRTILEAEIEYAPEQRFIIFGIHLVPWHSILLELWRWWEVKVIIQRAKQYSTIPCLILGDFNAIAPNDKVVTTTMPLVLRLMIWMQGQRIHRFAIREMLKAGFTDCYRQLHPNDDGYTLPPPMPNARLDYIFASELMKEYLQKCFVVREPAAVQKASDHYPVVAEFGLQVVSGSNM